MAAIREGLRRIDIALGVERFGNVAFVLQLDRLGGEIEQADLAIGADHREGASGIGDVLLVGFEHMCGERLALFQHRFDGADHSACRR